MRILTLAVSVLLTAPAGNAGQPISESMVQCSALYSVAGSWVENAEKAARLYSLSDAWVAASEARAAAEGISLSQDRVNALWTHKCAEWSSKGRLYVFSQDFRDWMSYCKALGREVGLPARP